MPQNFDELLSDDLSFIVRDELFRMTYVRPEVLAEWEDEDETTDESAAASIARLDRRVLSFLASADRDRWTALRTRETDAVPFLQLREIVRWMVEAQSSRPTVTLSPSGDGRGSNVPSSSGKSRSRAAIPAT